MNEVFDHGLITTSPQIATTDCTEFTVLGQS